MSTDSSTTNIGQNHWHDPKGILVKPIFFLAALLLTTNCSTTPEQSSFEPPLQTEDEEKEPAPILDQESLPIKDVLEEGFCYDDIYATYLQKTYVAKESAALGKVRSWRRRRARKRTIKNQSLFYARSHLVGPLPPYFGSLPVTSNRKVEFWMRYFKTRGRRTFMQWLVRAESFREIVAPILKQEGLPQEFFFLAMVESGFNNTAYSRSRATGTWQFMKATARLYNLKINHWVDERRDAAKSSIAAARYLRHLYAQFGDWYLAMAAYNAGPGKVRRAIRKTNSRDFWKISQTRYLRNETKHYVPKVLAALYLASDAKAHGFDVQQDPRDIMPQTTVAIKRPIRIAELAENLGVPERALRHWNPELIRGITPPTREPDGYPLRLPTSLAERYASIESKLSHLEVQDVLMHRIRRGETLSHIAERYKVRVSQIRQINPKINPRALRIGRKIAIPVPGVIVKQEASQTAQKDMG